MRRQHELRRAIRRYNRREALAHLWEVIGPTVEIITAAAVVGCLLYVLLTVFDLIGG